MIQQRTEEWMQQRAGHFTGSQIHRLMASGKGEMFGKTAKSYILEKFTDILTDGAAAEYRQFSSKATEWGNHYEKFAVRCYQEFTFNETSEVGFVEFSDRFGASPDRLIGEDGVLEVKCPYTCERHAEFLGCNTQEDLFSVAPEYFYQVQAEMICTGRRWADFVSYDPRFPERFCLKIIRVELDPATADEILKRVAAASQILDEMLKKVQV